MFIQKRDHSKQNPRSVVSCDKAALADLCGIRINTAETLTERALQFTRQVKNPYLFRVGDMAVSVIYCGTEPLTDLLPAIIEAG